MNGAPPGGGGVNQSLVDSSPLPPHMRSSIFDGRKYHLKVKRPGENPAALPNNPFWFAALMEAKFKRNLKNEITMAIESRGLSYTLTTYNPTLAEELKNIKQIDTNTAIEIIDHPGLNRTLGMVYQPESVDSTEEEILTQLKGQGVTAVRKITKYVEGKQIPTPLMVLTFGSTKLPKEIFFGWMKVEVRTYYESPMICRNCLEYRHTKKRCTNPTKCTRCTGPHSNSDNSCQNEFCCPHCPPDNNNHSAAGKKCPLYRHEEAVIRCKTDESISWAEARKKVGTPKATSYASVSGADSGKTSTQEKQIAHLTELVQQLTTEVKNLAKYKENYEKLQQEYTNYKQKAKNFMISKGLHEDRSRSASPAGRRETPYGSISPTPSNKQFSAPPPPKQLNLALTTPGKKPAQTAQNTNKRGAESPLADPSTKRNWTTEDNIMQDLTEDEPAQTTSNQSPATAGKKTTAAPNKGQQTQQPFRK